MRIICRALRPVDAVVQLFYFLVAFLPAFTPLLPLIPMSYSEASMYTAERVLGVAILTASSLMQAADFIEWRCLIEDRFFIRLIGRPSVLGASIALYVLLFKSRTGHISTFSLFFPDLILYGQIMLDVCFIWPCTSNKLTRSLVLCYTSLNE